VGGKLRDMNNEHPVVVITGAGSGIGRACAVRFAREGARVVVVDRTDADGQETVELLKSEGAEALFVHADVSSEDQCRRFSQSACDAFGRIDILVANAGVRVFGTILESTEEDWDKILGVNLKGVSFSCKAVLPKMIEQKSGAIVLIGSTTALTGRTNMPLYDATKFGVLSLTRSLAATYGADGIRVNAVCPSFTLTNFHFQRAAAQGVSPEELREKNKGYGLLGRPGEPEEIAAVVSFMAGKDASFVTGQYLIVDGGYSIGGRTSQKS
jgi:NAD(P)-dependent dehydrogenase (short-subunit alcohol dehydrogenase family)